MKRRHDSKFYMRVFSLKAICCRGFCTIIFLAGLVLPTVAEEVDAQSAGVDSATPVTDQIQNLKDEVISLNRDLFILEEELLFPASTQTAVFLSMNVGEFFNLDSVELKIDNRTETNYLYTDRQISALHRGGMQRLWLGNLKTGKHEVTAIFIGKGPQGRDYRRAATLEFEKSTEPKMLEARISDSTEKYQPTFEIIEWQ